MRFKIALYGHPIAKSMWICPSVVPEFTRMSHHPLPVLGLLPLQDGLGSVDVHVIYIAHTETVELDAWHVCIIAQSCLSANRIGQIRKGLAPIFLAYLIQRVSYQQESFPGLRVRRLINHAQQILELWILP